MIAVLPFHAGEVERVKELLDWCRVLGGCSEHDAFLVGDPGVPWVTAMEILEEAQRIFKGAQMITPDTPIRPGWPHAANQMFLFAACHMQEEGKQPWLWLESDAIPLKPNWLDTLDKAYQTCGKPYMGAVISGQLNGMPCTYLNGVAVYPANAYSQMEAVSRNAQGVAFDVATAAQILPLAANTPFIHCHWGLKDKPPVFTSAPDRARPEALLLTAIRPEAVLFHRNKDGSLIRLLRRSLSLGVGALLTVILPFCNKDGEQMIRNLHWMAELHGPLPYPAILLYPSDVSRPFLEGALKAAVAIFSPTNKISYRGTSTRNWPVGANNAFHAAAWAMEGVGPWLWLEPDAIPTRPDWLDVLSLEYSARRKPFFGPIVEGRGHMNGVSIYPADMARRCPRTMTIDNVAFDHVMKPEMINDCYDASRLIQHCWGIVGGRPNPVAGESAHFASQADVDNWLLPDTVLFHRCKDGSLIDRLRETLQKSCDPRRLFPPSYRLGLLRT